MSAPINNAKADEQASEAKPTDEQASEAKPTDEQASEAKPTDEQASEAKPTDATATETPVLTIINSDATPEEVAALVAVFAALGSSVVETEPAPVSEWNAPHRLVRTPHRHGPGGWRANGLPS